MNSIALLRCLSQVAGLEERLVGKSDLEHEKDAETMKSRKLVKLAEKYKRELEEANIEIRDLKAKLLETTEFRVSLCGVVWESKDVPGSSRL